MARKVLTLAAAPTFADASVMPRHDGGWPQIPPMPVTPLHGRG
ncbi:MAG TPA: hypothetical protein VKA73_04875 [Rubrobacter sp.]|nr:hypothetical protein [Rubrobacter sp.]